VFVAQDVRGKFRSEGETVAFVHEIDDGYDTLEWLIAQPWCDGNVGRWGDSYYGYTQWAAVASEHPALKAIVPRVTSADLAGTFEPESVIPLYMGHYLATCWLNKWMLDWEVDWAHRPLVEVFDAGFEAVGERSASFDSLVEKSRIGESLAPYPNQHPFDGLKIPVLHTGGWFDNLMPDQMRDYEALIARPDVAGLQYLDMNSTDHENYSLEQVPVGPEDDHNTDAEALARMLPTYIGNAIDFFDVFLKGMDVAFPRVRWHQGNDAWRVAERWPPPGAREMRLYPVAADRATADADGGALASEPEEASTTAHWVHDPMDLVPSPVTDPFAFLHECPDESAIETRSDVVTFTSAALDGPLDLVGPIAVQLAIGSSAASTAVFVKLVDVGPSGSAMMIARGQASVPRPDPSHSVRVDLAHLGYRVLPGHRLRLQIASSDFPLYLPHPGTDDDPWRAIDGRSSEQSLRTGSDVETYLSLTVVD
ncbi:MAG TPA: CocE/NonD family hydrolase, partial [Actinomycetota bacterium]